MLLVTNNNDSELRDRFNGQNFVFPAGKATAISEDAARLFFGFGESDKTNTLTRQGWMASEIQRASAMQRLNLFSFDVIDALAPGTVLESGPPPLLPEPVIEQGSAPLLGGAEGETVSGGTAKPSASEPVGGDTMPARGGAGSIIDRLSA